MHHKKHTTGRIKWRYNKMNLYIVSNSVSVISLYINDYFTLNKLEFYIQSNSQLVLVTI